jgi:ATP-binding cassette subfamily B multidrug efflux pump
MKSLLSLNHYFLRYKYYLLLGIVFVVLSNLFAIYPAQMVRSSFDLVAGQIQNISAMADSPGRESAMQDLKNEVLWYGCLIVAMALVRGLFLFFMRQTIIVMSRHIEFDQKNDIYRKYQSLPLRFYRQHNTGDLMARISEDVGRVRMYTGPAIMYGINMLVLFVMVIGYMLSVSVEFTVYVLLPLPVLSLAVYFINSEVQQRSDRIQQSLSGLATFVQESFSGIRVIKAFGREANSVKKFDEESQQYRDRSIHLGNLNAWFSPVIISLIGLSSILTVFAGGHQVMQGKITTGNIAEFLIYVNMLTWPVTSLGWVISMAQRAAVSQKRINEFLQEASVMQSTEDLHLPVNGELEFRHVSLRYPETGIQALQDISFQVKPGQSIGILGGTGSGKSSLANLVCRLFDPDEGEIMLDGRPIKAWNLQALRRQIGYVPQDVFLFSDTIRNNIFFGEDERNQQAMEKAAQQADLTENVLRFEKQFETIIGERGITLSGGQKQRLSLARALVRNPRILVLDDCLSAVDTSTEKTILANLKEEMKGRTTLIISHRISSVNLADTILVMEDGSIVQQGRHEDLISVQGPYRSLFEKQLVAEEG